MGILPGFAEYSGPHAVGTLTLEREISSGGLQFKYSSISTLLVRLFYPCTTTGTQKREPWIHGPRDELLKGYGEFMGMRPIVASIVSKLSFVSYLTMPALSNAPFKQSAHPYPVVIFSHGLGGHRSAYSQYCGNLASYGFMVVAIEHRDNSAPVTFVRGEEERVPFVRITQTNAYTIDKRRDQLQHRAAEVQFAVDMVREMNETGRVEGSSPLPLDFKAGSLCTAKMVCAGHSFGAATLVHALLSTDIAPAFEAAILLDPWMEPLVDYLQSRIHVPCLTILSDQFSKWVANYSHVKTMVKSQGNALCFVVRDSLHLSQSDFHAAFPRLIKRWQGVQISADTIMNLNVRASVEFLRQQGADLGQVQKADEGILAGDSGIAFMEQIAIK